MKHGVHTVIHKNSNISDTKYLNLIFRTNASPSIDVTASLMITMTAIAVCFRLLGLRVVNVYDVDNKTYLIKLAKLVL